MKKQKANNNKPTVMNIIMVMNIMVMNMMMNMNPIQQVKG